MESKAGRSNVDEKHDPEILPGIIIEAPINASGHHQQLDRSFNLLRICSLAITSGNTRVALGRSVTVAIYNGGAPGVLYEFIVVSFFYWLIAASIAELASAMPSSGGVYHWASITAGRYGRFCGWFAGYWNFFAWIFGLASFGADTGAAGCEHVCGISSGFCDAEVACFRGLSDCELGLLLSCAVCE